MFLLLDLPTILALHIETYWSARAAVSSGLVGRREEGLDREKEVGRAYHARLPLLSVGNDEDLDDFALSPLYLTSLADALLRLYLSPAEYEVTVERVVIREVLGRSVLGSVGKKVGKGWFWWSIGLKLLGEPGLKASMSRQVREERDVAEVLIQLFNRIWAIAILVWMMGASMAATLSAARPVQDKYCGIADPWLQLGRAILGVDGRSGMDRSTWRKRLVWGGVEIIIAFSGSVLDRYDPLTRDEARADAAGRLLPHFVETRLLTPTNALRIIDLVEHILFPLEGYPGVSPPDPTPDEASEMRQLLETRLEEVIPGQFLPSSEL